MKNSIKLALAVASLLSASAVTAQSARTLCDVAPAQIQQAAALKAGTTAAKKALFNSGTAVKLCEAGAAKAAQKKFKVAYKALDLDFAAAMAQSGAQAN
jgi:ABC-type metal ion transport system substrate-binding protein